MRSMIVFGVVAMLSAAQAIDFKDYFPSDTGLSWRYSLTKHTTITAGPDSRRSETTGSVTDRVAERANSSTAVIRRTVSQTTSTGAPTMTESSLHVSVMSDAVSVAAIAVGTATPNALAVPQPLLLRQLPGPEIEGSIGTLKLATRLVSQSASSTEVPAGKFSDCIVTETSGTASGALNGLAVQKGTIEVKAWYARGVGLVREERVMRLTVSGPAGMPADLEEVTVKALTTSAGQ
jgi:hypothetical protein